MPRLVCLRDLSQRKKQDLLDEAFTTPWSVTASRPSKWDIPPLRPTSMELFHRVAGTLHTAQLMRAYVTRSFVCERRDLILAQSSLKRGLLCVLGGRFAVDCH